MELYDDCTEKSVTGLLCRWRGAVAKGAQDIGRTHVDRHRIDTGTYPPIRQAARRLHLYNKEEATKEINEMLSGGVTDSHPLPRIDDTLDLLGGATWFSTLDLASGYWQIEMDPIDRAKTAFSAHQGLFQFKVMPFGLCNAWLPSSA